LFVETKPYQLYNNFSEGMSQLGGSVIGVSHDSIPPIAQHSDVYIRRGIHDREFDQEDRWKQKRKGIEADPAHGPSRQ
jgi:hypothetical protein